MILSSEILTLYILNGLFLFFASIALYLSIKIVLHWDPNATTKLQYRLENYSYLSATIVKFIFAIKVPLFIFFIFTLDKLSNIISGAMCGAGVVDATTYGSYILLLKVLNLYLFAYWIVLNKQDSQFKLQPYVKQKFMLFIALYILLVSEIVLESLMFGAIDLESVVDCCGVIYSSSSGTYIASVLALDTTLLLSLFYGVFLLIALAYYYRVKYLFSILNLLFIIISLVTLIAFFGTYIYELPTHKCPFCFLQKEYNYVGYGLYISLFIGTFNGLVLAFIEFTEKESEKFYKLSLLFNLLYTLSVTYYPVMFYIKNGVWL